MWDKAKAFVSEHPWGTAAGVFIVGLLLIYMFAGGKSKAAVSSGPDLGPYYNAQAAAVQAGADTFGQQVAAQASVANNTANTQADITKASYEAQTAQVQSNNWLTYQNNLIQAELDAHLADLSSPHALELAQAGYSRDVSLQQSSDQAAVDIAKAEYNSSVAIAGLQAGTDQAYIDYLAGVNSSNNQTKVALAQVGADIASDYNKSAVDIQLSKDYTTRYTTAVDTTGKEYLQELSVIGAGIGTGNYDIANLAEYSADLRSPIVYNLAYLQPTK